MKAHIAPVAVGVVVGLLVAPVLGLTVDTLQEVYDLYSPIVEATAQVVNKSDKNWQVVMYSKKKRDCRLLEVQAYDVSPAQEVIRLSSAREDGAPPTAMAPGHFRSVAYLITPAPKYKLMLSFLHECNGRTVRSQVAVKGA